MEQDKTPRSIVARVLEGANGTILAYGQTGSGKTYTMTGQRYSARIVFLNKVSDS